MTLRTTFGLVMLIAVVAAATAFAGTWSSSSKPHQVSVRVNSQASPEVFERAVVRAGAVTLAPEFVDRPIVNTRDARAAVTMAPDFVDRPVVQRSMTQLDQTLDPAIAAAIRAHNFDQTLDPAIAAAIRAHNFDQTLDPAIAAAIRAHNFDQTLDPAIAAAIRAHN
jgi:hypothetical protein